MSRIWPFTAVDIGYSPVTDRQRLSTGLTTHTTKDLDYNQIDDIDQ